MKFFVAGGTGVIGRPLIAELLAKGHTVVALTRSADEAPALVKRGIEPAVADVFARAATSQRGNSRDSSRPNSAPPSNHLEIVLLTKRDEAGKRLCKTKGDSDVQRSYEQE